MRTASKEIAIRKVNGASVKVILNLFFKEYLLLLIVASFIAFPLGYAIMKHWLEGLCKQTSIDLWIYAGIFVAMLLIIFIMYYLESLESCPDRIRQR